MKIIRIEIATGKTMDIGAEANATQLAAMNKAAEEDKTGYRYEEAPKVNRVSVFFLQDVQKLIACMANAKEVLYQINAPADTVPLCTTLTKDVIRIEQALIRLEQIARGN